MGETVQKIPESSLLRKSFRNCSSEFPIPSVSAMLIANNPTFHSPLRQGNIGNYRKENNFSLAVKFRSAILPYHFQQFYDCIFSIHGEYNLSPYNLLPISRSLFFYITLRNSINYDSQYNDRTACDDRFPFSQLPHRP